MDWSDQSIKDSMFMGNMFPQVRNFNRGNGAWRYSEDLVECLRDGEDIEVLAGVIVVDDQSNDFFIDSHGVPTPEWAWKLIYRPESNTYQVFLMDNSSISVVTGATGISPFRVELAKLINVLEDDWVKLYLLGFVEHKIQVEEDWSFEAGGRGNQTLSCGDVTTERS